MRIQTRGALSARCGLAAWTALFLGLSGAVAAAEDDDTASVSELSPIDVVGTAERADGPVEGYLAGRSDTGTKTGAPIIETPQSISVITREQIEDRGADSLTAAVGYAPGVVVQNRAASSVIDSFSIRLRGFSAQDATFRDGTQLQAGLPYDAPLETYGLERIEVLRGPASVLYGQGQPGGIINLVTKQPTEAPLRELGVELGSDNHRQIFGDVSDRIDEAGQWRYRLTGLWQEADTHVDFVNDDRVYFAPALRWEPSAGTRLTLLGQYQSNETRYPWSAFPRAGTKDPGPNGQIPDNRYIGEPSFDRYDSETLAAGSIFEHALGPKLRFRQNLRYRRVEYDILDTFRNYFGPYIDDDLRTLLDRGNRARYDEGDTFTADNRLIASLAHGVFEHTLLVGADYKTLTYDRSNSGFLPIEGSGADLDLFDPVYGREFSTPQPEEFTDSRTEADQVGAYIQDHLRIAERFVLNLGARFDSVSERSSSAAERDQDELTLRGGAVYLFDGGWAPYASYSESFTPQYGRNELTGVPYDPISGEQIEAGLRWRPPGMGLALSAAAFDIRRSNEVVQNPANPGNPNDQVQVGETSSKGAELELIADLAQGLKVTGAYTWQRVEVEESGGSGTTNGNRLSDRPEHLGNLWVDYSVLHGPLAGLGVGGGLRYTGTAYADAANTLKQPVAMLVDATVRYDVSPALRLQLSARNLLDEQPVYCSGRQPTSTCDYGVPRELLGSLTYRWQ